MGNHSTKEDAIDIRRLNPVVLEANDLEIGYSPSKHRSLIIASDLNLNLNKGELVCLVGPNGVGKSTLLRSLAGLQPHLKGEVCLNGLSLQKLSSRELAKAISIVLTETVNVGVMQAFSVVALGRHPYTNWLGTLTEEDEQIVMASLRSVDAEDLTQHYFHELSDGERQKIMIARALAQEPSILMLDEPTAFLDLPRRVIIMQVLRNLAHNMGKVVLVSTHDLDLALKSADVIWLMSQGGKLNVGAPEDLVLNGAFEKAFSQQGVSFDSNSGNFEVAPHPIAKIGLEGKDIQRKWTARALERAGFEVLPFSDYPDYSVEVIHLGEKIGWKFYNGGESSDYESIYALIKGIKSQPLP
ncbi:MAG: ABC transporter ATP-binding protein [Anaerolineaceae bacterium]|nr:ABC transporter ATP-binding protein [Anaerolineaceae bacterium]